MDLNEYIKMSYKRPNRKVLEGLGASEDLIEYLMEAPWNTNFNMLSSFGFDSGNGSEVWFTGTINMSQPAQNGYRFVFSLTTTESADVEKLTNNPTDYNVFINDIFLPYYHGIAESHTWGDNEDLSLGQTAFGTESGMWYALVPENWTGEVEVFVKAK